MIDTTALLADCTRRVRALVADLRDAADAAVVDEQHRGAVAAGRTALGRVEWAEGLYAQVAVAWVLGCVFVRFCEDNGLVAEPLLAGPGARTKVALGHRAAWFAAHPADDDRHWLREVFGRYRALAATGDVFGDHNPVWLLAPSADAARELLAGFQVDPATGEVPHDFTDPTWGTRFLGDLYQDLSEHARKQYALLQTPVFVEEFILDRTLGPALRTFGLRGTDLIDPTCGSGHFLLGAFERLLEAWREEEPGTNVADLVRRALDAVAGVDVNPFAVAIARFRLLVAALKASGQRSLVDLAAFPIHVAVADSLLHTSTQLTLTGIGSDDDLAAASAHGYATEDVEAARVLLSRQWACVVGNPPYITVKDPALNALYRRRYKTCHRLYSLGVPFTQRFWQLARTDRDPERCGYVGMITANSFMKREFGKKLVEDWVPRHDLTHVIDTSGAYIPGHGTPTVILFGRPRQPVQRTVRAVMGIRGEPSKPADPTKGLVWSSIVNLVDEPGSQCEYVSVVDLDRARLATHPWSIGGGGAAELKELMDERARAQLGSLVKEIGRTTHTGEDDVYVLPRPAVATRGWSRSAVPLVIGEDVRDWVLSPGDLALFPYDHEAQVRTLPEGTLACHYWSYRANLRSRLNFGQTNEDRGLAWHEYTMFFRERFRTPLSIAFADVATHNHFVLDRGGKVFNRTAPVIKLPAGATEDDHLELLAILNSAPACFWMQQTFHNKGGPGGGSTKDEKWNDFFAHDGTKMKSFPLPPGSALGYGRVLDDLARGLAEATPAAVCVHGTPTAAALDEARRTYDALRSRMVAVQEELDWHVAHLYGLTPAALTVADLDAVPPLNLGERAFEVVLARRLAAGDVSTKWFTKFGGNPTTEPPAHWPDHYRRVVTARIEAIEADVNVGLVERPESKRRWEAPAWDDLQRAALRAWLCDRLESPTYWPDPPALTTCARLGALARADDDFVAVARLWAGRDDVDVAAVVTELATAEAVPYLAALRYTEAGLRTHQRWLATWGLQRREDAGEDVGPIPVPPKYAKADFVAGAWEHRGKLDVAKERFVSYPHAGRENDPSPVVGWAGWGHLARARALAAWYVQARDDRRGATHLTPILAGLAELVPWLRQWHNDPSPDPALDHPGDQVAALVDAELRALHLTPADLAAWRPPARAKGRPRKA